MLKYLIIASVFLFNPLVSNIDILPDLVAYLLIIKAFSKASYVYTCTEELVSSARKMAIVSAVKLFSIIMVSSFDPTMSLLLSFCFGIVEVIFGIPFFVKLFGAISYIVPYENKAVHSISSKIRRFTIAAFVARLVLAVLPDLTALSLNSAFTLDTDYTFLRFKPLFIGFSVIVALSFSIIWLVKIIRYFIKAISKEVTDKIENDFSVKTEKNKSLFLAKDGIRVAIIIAVSSLFIFDFTWEYINVDIFQDFMLTLVASLAFLYLIIRKVYKIDKLYVALLGVLALHIGLDVLEMVSSQSYFEKYNMESMLKVSEAEDMYFVLCVSAILSSIALVASVVLILLVMKSNARHNILKHRGIFSEVDIEYYLKEFEKRSNKKIALTASFAGLSALVYSLTVILRPYADWMTLVDMVCQILFIIIFISSLLYIYDEVYKRILTFS